MWIFGSYEALHNIPLSSNNGEQHAHTLHIFGSVFFLLKNNPNNPLLPKKGFFCLNHFFLLKVCIFGPFHQPNICMGEMPFRKGGRPNNDQVRYKKSFAYFKEEKHTKNKRYQNDSCVR
jgi:hypothetical protein